MKTVGIHFRASESERDRFRAWAAELGMSQNDLFRELIKLVEPGETDGPIRRVELDVETMRNIAAELKRLGYRFNEVNHALNSAAYLLRLGEESEEWSVLQVKNVCPKLERIQEGVDEIRAELAAIPRQSVLYL